ncbi:MAG: succinyl-diaminopimelate desuccinylase, partial [Alphaproteobacteria bacterium]|nr:succinyl-diaminopimelate desuccinylase [Alphaproteobacteria bacterium]
SIALIITGDEEGPAVNGTRPMLERLAARGERIDACVVGEPTNPARFGEMMKIGRRGSLNARLVVEGVQGHAAYPDLADNPVHPLLEMTHGLASTALDDGTAHFQPSSLQVTSVDVGNPTTNLIPARAEARFNIRFNDLHTGAGLEERLRGMLDRQGHAYRLDVSVSGESFLTPPGPLVDLAAEAMREVTGRTPELSTSGGTSDARFIKDYCPVVELGLVSETAHKVDEYLEIEDLEKLTRVYERMLAGYFLS